MAEPTVRSAGQKSSSGWMTKYAPASTVGAHHWH